MPADTAEEPAQAQVAARQPVRRLVKVLHQIAGDQRARGGMIEHRLAEHTAFDRQQFRVAAPVRMRLVRQHRTTPKIFSLALQGRQAVQHRLRISGRSLRSINMMKQVRTNDMRDGRQGIYSRPYFDAKRDRRMQQLLTRGQRMTVKHVPTCRPTKGCGANAVQIFCANG